MEYSEENVICMALECLDATLAEVVPDLDCLVVASCYDIGFICTGIELDIIDAFLMSFHCEISRGRS